MVKEELNAAFSTGGVIALSCWAPLHKQLPAQATPTNLEVPYLQVTEPTHLSQRAPEHVVQYFVQCHGDCDPVVPYRWGQLTSTLLKVLNRRIRRPHYVHD